MTIKSHSVPFISMHDRVILFDGVCKMCHAWTHFIIRYDKKYQFKLCSVQSEEGIQILTYFDYPTDNYETMLYVEDGICYERSDAFLKVVTQLNYPWKILSFLSILPKGFRDWGYNKIALNRYAFFGKYDSCVVPTVDHERRYLSSKIEK